MIIPICTMKKTLNMWQRSKNYMRGRALLLLQTWTRSRSNSCKFDVKSAEQLSIKTLKHVYCFQDAPTLSRHSYRAGETVG